MSDELRERLADALAYRPGSSAYDYADRILPIIQEAHDLLRDLCIDWVPYCPRRDCQCTASRATRYLHANGVAL